MISIMIDMTAASGDLVSEQCAQVAAKLSGYVEISVNGTIFTSANPPDMESAGAACQGTGSAAMISVIYQ